MGRDLPFAELTRRFLLYQRARNLADGTLRHYQESFADFTRYCAACRLVPHSGSLTSEFFHDDHA